MFQRQEVDLQSLGTYEHFKGGVYSLHEVNILSADDAETRYVLYSSKETGQKWMREQKEFFGLTETGQQRFKKVG